MRLRKKHWAFPEMEKSPLAITENLEKLQGHWREEFANNNPIHLELGCGRGGFITQKALENPNINYIGVDLKNEVLVYALRKVVKAEVHNVRLIPMKIENIDQVFAEDEIDKIYINFCNPWPKERHKKRRLTHNRFLNNYRLFLKQNGEIWFKTDDVGLFEESFEYFKECGFVIEFSTYDLHHSEFKENIMTEYEDKFTSLGMNTHFIRARLLLPLNEATKECD